MSAFEAIEAEEPSLRMAEALADFRNGTPADYPEFEILQRYITQSCCDRIVELDPLARDFYAEYFETNWQQDAAGFVAAAASIYAPYFLIDIYIRGAIAETLGISPNTAASRYRYGLDKLRQRLRPLYDEIK